MTTTMPQAARTATTPPAVRERRVLPVRAGGIRAFQFVVLLAFAVFFILPIVWLLLAPTKTDAQLVSGSPFAFGSFSDLAAAWRHLFGFQDGVFLVWMRNSALYSLGSMVITLVAGIPAGYALAVGRFRGRRVLLVTTLIVMVMPNTALVLPVFLEMNTLHLIGTAWSVILPLSFFPFGVYLTYIYFSTTLPADLLDAARIDGCGEWRIFRSIALPLARPVVALVAFFSFVAGWNNFFLPFVMLPTSDAYPLPVGLDNLVSSTPSFNPSVGAGALDIYRPELALATLLAILPVLAMFLVSQRALVSGMLAGATKG